MWRCRLSAALRRVPSAVAFRLSVIVLTIASMAVPVSAVAEGDVRLDPSTLSPDLRAELAARRLTEVKRQIAATLSGACSTSVAAWDAWFDGVVSVAATLIAVGDMDGPLKKSGASPERLRASDHAKGSALAQFDPAEAAKRKIDLRQDETAGYLRRFAG